MIFSPTMEDNSMPTYENDPLSDYACKICSERFPSRSEMFDHWRSHMDAPKRKCQMCSVMFRTRRDMLMRMDDKTDLKCQGCSKIFRWKDLALTYKCSVCSKSYKTRGGYLKHALSHSKGSTNKCEFCAATYKSNGPLLAHLKRHADRNKYKFNRYKKSTKHMMAYVKWHDEGLQFSYQLLERPGKQFFKCGVCSNVFYTKELLQNHIFKSHIEENPSNAEGNLCLVQNLPHIVQEVRVEPMSQEPIIIDDSSDEEHLVTNDEQHFVRNYEEYFISNGEQYSISNDEEHFVTTDDNLDIDDINGNEDSTPLLENRENSIPIEIKPGIIQLPKLIPKPPDNFVIKEEEDETVPDEDKSGNFNGFFFSVLQQTRSCDQVKLEGGLDEDIAMNEGSSSVLLNSSYIKEEPCDIEATKIVFAYC